MSLSNTDFKHKQAEPNMAPRKKGILNEENYKSYVKFLEKHRLKFPSNDDGEVNVSCVAQLCGFDRQVFYKNQTLGTLLTEDAKRIGTDVIEGRDPSNQLNEEVAELSKQLNDAKRDLALADEENAGLKKQLMEARNTIKRLEKDRSESVESLHHMIETGRRFTL